MTIVAITGDHPRHAYLVSRLAEAGILAGWIIEKRAPFVPVPPDDCVGRARELFVLHFARREAAERRFFGDGTTIAGASIPTLDVTAASLNDPATLSFIRRSAPRIVLSYGCHKLSGELIREAGCGFWNVHGGLSPQYRGVTTHFWPSYFLEPQMTGMTLHETTDAIDGGAIIHQSAGTMTKGDGLHDLAARTVKEFAGELPMVLAGALKADTIPAGRKQGQSGKVWMAADWRPDHLALIYDHYEDAIVDLLLDGGIVGRVPSLVRAV